MKFFLLIFLILIPSFVYGMNGKVYYCSEKDKVGFDTDVSRKITKYKTRRFKVLIDFEKPFIKSKEIYMDVLFKSCHVGEPDNQIYCYSIIGNSFTINKQTLNFVYTHITPGDTSSISHGKCETFWTNV